MHEHFPRASRRALAATGAASLGALGLRRLRRFGSASGDGDGKAPTARRRRAAGCAPRLRRRGAPATPDPHLANLFADVARAKALFDKLADSAGADLSARPRLAESGAEQDPWTAGGVTPARPSSTRRPATAEDVLYSYRRITDPKQAFRAKASLEPSTRSQPRHRHAVDRVRPEAAHRRIPNLLAAFGAYIVLGLARDLGRSRPARPVPLRLLRPGIACRLPPQRRLLGTAPLPGRAELVVANEESARVGPSSA
ncbi:hypothetical protein LT493_10025 [Streptomyces tricolor]|nr:hypothetical protein [Streptomyces tricolor]